MGPLLVESAWPAAPVPRPPQPTRPILSFRLSGLPRTMPGAAMEETAETAAADLRKERRLGMMIWFRGRKAGKGLEGEVSEIEREER